MQLLQLVCDAAHAPGRVVNIAQRLLKLSQSILCQFDDLCGMSIIEQCGQRFTDAVQPTRVRAGPGISNVIAGADSTLERMPVRGEIDTRRIQPRRFKQQALAQVFVL